MVKLPIRLLFMDKGQEGLDGIAHNLVRWGLPNYYMTQLGPIATDDTAKALFLALENSKLMDIVGFTYDLTDWEKTPDGTYDFNPDTSKNWTEDPVRRLAGRIASWIINEIPVYATKLKALDEAEEKGLMAGVTSTGQTATRNNDLPDGDSSIENYYDDEAHASYTTHGNNTTTTDFDTPMARAREIVERYPSLVDDMCKAFEKEFCLYE